MLARLILRALLWPLWVRSCKCSFSCLLKFTTYFFFTTASLHQFGIVVGGKFIPFIYCGEVLAEIRATMVITAVKKACTRASTAAVTTTATSQANRMKKRCSRIRKQSYSGDL